MKILLVGEYSNVHWTLAEGLRALGHEVTVVSDGDGWKNYPRNINLKRGPLNSKLSTLNYLRRLAYVFPRLRGFDVVQLINPVFLDLRAERIWPFYHYLRRHNGKVFLGAFGIDHYWVKVGMDCKTFRYSDFNFGSQLRDYPFMRTMVADWLNGHSLPHQPLFCHPRPHLRLSSFSLKLLSRHPAFPLSLQGNRHHALCPPAVESRLP